MSRRYESVSNHCRMRYLGTDFATRSNGGIGSNQIFLMLRETPEKCIFQTILSFQTVKKYSSIVVHSTETRFAASCAAKRASDDFMPLSRMGRIGRLYWRTWRNRTQACVSRSLSGRSL